MIAGREAPTIGALRRVVASALDEAFRNGGRTGTPALDARILVAEALGVDPDEVVFVDEQPASDALRMTANRFAEQRAAGEPVARIVGRKEFWGLDFALSPETLVPRPDTEIVVSAALAAIDRDNRRNEELRILDIGTGSGAILLALLSELPRATGVGTDRAAGAVKTARGNAEGHGLDCRADFVVADWAAPLAGGFDVIVSNPPYIRSDVITTLPVEVREHDPHLGVDGGFDGLMAYRKILPDLERLLGPRGRAFLEVGTDQANRVSELAVKEGFHAVRHCDLGEIERVVELSRQAGG